MFGATGVRSSAPASGILSGGLVAETVPAFALHVRKRRGDGIRSGTLRAVRACFEWSKAALFPEQSYVKGELRRRWGGLRGALRRNGGGEMGPNTHMSNNDRIAGR